MDPLNILRKGSWITIVNLAAADLAVCIITFTVPFQIKTISFQVTWLLWHSAVSSSFMLLAFFWLQVLTVTKFPYKARHFWTRNRVISCCVSIWLLAGLLGSVEIFSHYVVLSWTVRTAVWDIVIIFQIVLKILTYWEIFKSRRNSGQSQSSSQVHLTIQITTTVMI